MNSSIYLTLLFFWMTRDCVNCIYTKTPIDLVTVELGDSVTLNCTYNCSSGFVQGYWSKALDIFGCHMMFREGSFCTVFLCLTNVSAGHLKNNYTCYTVDKEDPQLQQKTERLFLLQLRAQRSLPNTDAPKNYNKNASFPAKPNSSGGEFTGIKVLATVSVAVALVLAALAVYLCFNRNRQNWNGKEEPVVSKLDSPQSPHVAQLQIKGSTQSERVTLRIPPPDNESDTEVPYADIMITVRGVSTPELTQVGYLIAGDQKERWGDKPRCHLQASRSADRLHVPQVREVSRKMSTNSEYAVITYA
ncbi:uncharacterized protein LOC102305931 isoform X1 [Haplochromis burtoni]|uniref:uncharacterized protein LOC102305931 isoform X1 n=1 Tax=Haplochromis burtoni TaxID=8153 RepID=UPI0003BD8714|nr:uncharacterized protein LOC102305931 isoform X1 [Haplochromis burtoni]